MSNISQRCKRLSQLRSGEDILPVSAALSPGSHCPLFGVVMSAPFIKDLPVLVLGEEECCWNAYNQHIAENGPGGFYTYTMDDMDIIYGVAEGLTKAVRELYEREHFRALMLVSSCIPELTGEDLERLAQRCALPVKVLTAHTSHYNSTGYYAGISHFYEGLFPLIREEAAKNGKIALLGARYPGLEESEIPSQLKSRGFEVFVPGSIDDVEALSGCALTLVCDVTALSLAEKIEERFSVPFLRADHLMCPEKILKVYTELDRILDSGLASFAEAKYAELRESVLLLKPFWQEKYFVSAVPFCLPFEACEFFSLFGMRPRWLVARDIYPGDREIIDRLLSKGIDCPVSSFSSLSNLALHYKELDAELYFGFASPEAADGKSGLIINPRASASMTGFSFPELIIKKMRDYAKGDEKHVP